MPSTEAPRRVALQPAQAFAMAQQLHRQGDLDAAEALYERLIGSAPRHASALHFMGVLQHKRHRSERALALSPDHGTVLFQVALIKYYAQDWDESLRLAERAVEINPHVPEALHTLAGALTRFERYDEALELLDRADHFAPHGYGFAISLINRCWVLFGMGRIDAALEAANRLLQVLPSDHTGLMLRPVFHAALGQWELAQQHLAELRRVFPGEDLDLFMGTIRASRQADGPRSRNAELFEQVWTMATVKAPQDQTLSAIAG